MDVIHPLYVHLQVQQDEPKTQANRCFHCEAPH